MEKEEPHFELFDRINDVYDEELAVIRAEIDLWDQTCADGLDND